MASDILLFAVLLRLGLEAQPSALETGGHLAFHDKMMCLPFFLKLSLLPFLHHVRQEK